jgi:superoxide dismutase, Fe-Mn family
VPGFLSKATYEETWIQLQDELCERLNEETQGTSLASETAKELQVKFAKDRSRAALYNYAAQAHHNHFFFKGLSHQPEPSAPAPSMLAHIEEWFESMEQLREMFSDTARAMFGPGYIWLMAEQRHSKPMRVLTTYNTGSPFPEAHTRQQSRGAALTRSLTAGSFGDSSMNRAEQYHGAFVGQPILCLKMFEHQWMRDYGLAGKDEYVSNWWKRIDWDTVLHRYNTVSEYAGPSAGMGLGGMTPASRETANQWTARLNGIGI